MKRGREVAELIFEIGCEELPAGFIEPALEQMKAAWQQRCEDARISFGEVRTFATPRRLVLIVDEIADKQSDLEEVRTGPPARAAYRDGAPTKAAEGFARGQGVAVEDLYLVETPKGEYVAARVFEEGLPTKELVPEILTSIIQGLHFPKSMRWAALRNTFARPVRWLLAMLDGELVSLEFAGVKSGKNTYGHRFSAPGEIEVRSVEHYEDKLAAADVMLSQQVRRSTIRAMLSVCAEQAGGVIIDDPALVDEVAFLVENVNAVLVTFSHDYLQLPDEVLISSMRSHQRYFAVAHPETGALLNSCVVIYNTPVRDADVVRAGNLRVLKARLEDAKFFWEQDLKTPLADRVEKLDDVVWLRELGTLHERSSRMSQLAATIAGQLGFDEHRIDTASRAAYLSKTDLLTDMVGEFPDLQGIIGRAYAVLNGEGDAVAQALLDQYLPRGADDDLPATDPGACVALAERLDALVGIFGVGKIPKSSADPYALRRAALGVLRILQGRAWNLSIRDLVSAAYGIYSEQGKQDAFVTEEDALVTQVTDFIRTRLKHSLANEFSTDVVDAVLAVSGDDVLSARDRVEALAQLRDEADFEPLAIGFKRVVNILRKQADAHYEIPETVDADLLEDLQERELLARYEEAKRHVEGALETRDWAAACKGLITLKAPIDAFFDHVMVMAEDENLRRNRLAILDQLRGLFMQVADISMIQTDR